MKSNASIAEAVSVAAGSLRSSKLRSFLTLLGIILATTTLIAVMAVIHGMDLYISQQVSDMGGDGFRVVRLAMIGEHNPKKYLEMNRRNPKLRKDEFEFLQSHVTQCRDLGMEGYQRVPVHYEKENVDGVLRASANIYLLLNKDGGMSMGVPQGILGTDLRANGYETFKLTVAQGRDLTEQDHGKAVVGCDIAKALGAKVGKVNPI